jgi:hypothetical protein
MVARKPLELVSHECRRGGNERRVRTPVLPRRPPLARMMSDCGSCQ